MCYYDNPKHPEQVLKAKALSELSGFKNVVSYAFNLKENQPAKYAFKEACQQGKVALSFESGKLGNVQMAAVRQNKNGIYRILNHLEMYQTTFSSPPPKITRFNKQHYLKAPRQGVFYSDYKAGDRVSSGDIVGHIKDEFGNVLVEISAPSSGIILYKIGTPPVNFGETLMCLTAFQ